MNIVHTSPCIQLVRVSNPSDLTESIVRIPSSSFSNVTGGSNLAPQVITVWQQCRDNGWFLLGDLTKYVALSPKRFANVKCTKISVSVTVVGMPNEILEVTALMPVGNASATRSFSRSTKESNDRNIAFQVVTKSIRISAAGSIQVSFDDAEADRRQDETHWQYEGTQTRKV